jgi:soluble lytic murein transglycosylase-like protein
MMKRLLFLVCALAAAASGAAAERARQGHAQYDALIATIATANLVPEALVHRVIVRESKYNPALVGRGGTIGLMQIKLATARGVGYAGDAEGLRNPETNLTYGVKYLAGAYRAAGGDHDRAMRYYASGYYHVAKQQRHDRLKQARSGPPNAPPQELVRSASLRQKLRNPRAKPQKKLRRMTSRRPPRRSRKGPRASLRTPGRRFPSPRPPFPTVQTGQSRVDTLAHGPKLELFRGELRRRS